MKRTEAAKQFLDISIGIAISIFALWLGSKLEMSKWLKGVVTLTLIMLCALFFNYRQQDTVGRLGYALAALGLVSLAALSLINEYITHFFNPSIAYLFIALSPSAAFLQYHHYLNSKKANLNQQLHADDESSEDSPRLRTGYRLLVLARIGNVANLIILLALVLSGTFNGIRLLFVSSAMLFMLADALICFWFPQLDKRTPVNYLLASLWATSPLSSPHATRGKALFMAILYGTLFVGSCIMLRDKW